MTPGYGTLTTLRVPPDRPTDQLGYRQRAVLTKLREAGHPVPFGYVVRACPDDCHSSYNNTSVSLRLLEQRGLVRRTRRGMWEAA